MEEVHNKQFRGLWVPPEIMEFVENETITLKEAWLLLTIESLVQHGGEDCWASNEYLAERLHLTAKYISDLISHLKDLHLLIETSFDGRRRFLRTYYSKIPEAAPGKTRPQPPEKSGGYYMSKTSRVNTMSRGADAPISTDTKRLAERWIKMASQLAEAISKVHKVNKTSSIYQWGVQFYQLHKTDKVPTSRIRKALDWYCKELPSRYREEFFLVIDSGSTFRRKFSRLELAIKKETDTVKTSTTEPPVIQGQATWD